MRILYAAILALMSAMLMIGCKSPCPYCD